MELKEAKKLEIFQGKIKEIILFVIFSGLLVYFSYLCKTLQQKKLNLIGKRWTFFLLSILLIFLCTVSLIVKGLKYGMDFKGGTILEVAFYKSLSSEDIRNALITVDENLKQSKIQILKKDIEGIKEKPQTFVLIRTDFLDQTKINNIYKAFEKELGRFEKLKSERVGPTLGKELQRSALIAIILALSFQLIYIACRFGYNIRYGIAADIALIHDVIIMIGFYSLFNKEADSPFLAALLTVIGYSVMDSIVIFDRIRENLKIFLKETFENLVNASILQTMTRSINTLLTVLFTLFALYFFGGATLKNFAFALTIGVISGAYSSIFIAAPLLVEWEHYSRKTKKEKAFSSRIAKGVPSTPLSEEMEKEEEAISARDSVATPGFRKKRIKQKSKRSRAKRKRK